MIKDKKEIMKKIREIFARISEDNHDSAEITQIRTEILSLLEDVIRFYVNEDDFDLWVKDCLASAISAFNWNISRRKSTSMLRACLVDIELSTTEEKNRSQSYPRNRERVMAIEEFNQDDFIEAINSLRKNALL